MIDGAADNSDLSLREITVGISGINKVGPYDAKRLESRIDLDGFGKSNEGRIKTLRAVSDLSTAKKTNVFELSYSSKGVPLSLSINSKPVEENQTSIYEHEFRVRYCIESKMKFVQRKRTNSLWVEEDKTMRSRAKRPVVKGSHSNNRKGWMSKAMWMLKMVWFWCHLSKMHCSHSLNKRKEKHNKLEEDR